MKKLTSSLLGAAALTAVLSVGVTSQAAVQSFNLDSSQSYLNLSGDAFGLSLGGQSTGATRDYFSGSIVADLTAGVFTFSGGSTILASINPAGPFSISPYPGGPLAGNYGLTGTGFVPGYGISTVNANYGNLVLDLTAGSAQNGAAPSGMTDTWTAGVLTWGANTGLGPTGGTSSMVGVNGADSSAGLVSWDGTTLTLPITFHTTGSNRNEYWTGQLVAVIPEPSTLALVGLGLVGLVAVQARRSRQSR